MNHKVQTSLMGRTAALLLSLPICASAAKYDVAAYVWPAYHPEPRWKELGIFADGKGEWQNLYESTKRTPDDYQGVKPLWGYEDESDPVAVARKIDAATAAGVNVFIYDWYWYGGRPFLEDALNKGFLGAGSIVKNGEGTTLHLKSETKDGYQTTGGRYDKLRGARRIVP